MSGGFSIVVLGFLGLFLLLPLADACSSSFKVPTSKLYATKGKTARFSWDQYMEKNKGISSKQYYYNLLAINDATSDSTFKINHTTCPKQFLNPTRVSQESKATLVVTNVKQEDAGLYSFTGIFKSCRFLISVQLIVTDTPKFTVRPSPRKTITENSELRILCSAAGSPSPKVTWIRLRGLTKVILSQGIGNAVLHISSIKKNQQGLYQCQAVNNPNHPITTLTQVIVSSPGPPSSPVIQEIHVNQTSIMLKWSRPDKNGGDITKYKIYSKVVCDSGNWLQVGLLDGKSLTYTVGSLEPSQMYGFIVTASNKYGESVFEDCKAKIEKIPAEPTTTTSFTTRDNIETVPPTTANRTTTHTESKKPLYGTTSCKSPAHQSDQGELAALGVCGVFLFISLFFNIIFVVYICRSSRKKCGYPDDRDNVVDMATRSTSPVVEGNAPKHQSNAKIDCPSEQGSHTNPCVPGYEIPELSVNVMTNQDNHQLNQAKLRQDAEQTAAYEVPLRTEPLKIRIDEGSEQHTYQPLRNRSTEYQSLQTYCNVNNASVI